MENERYIAKNIQVCYDDGFVRFVYKSIDGYYFKSYVVKGIDIEEEKWRFAENVFRQLKISLLLKEIYIGIYYYERTNKNKPEAVVINIGDFRQLEYMFAYQVKQNLHEIF